ncbi:MAG: prephenate dehydrogenase/arogenate dehydrogenase family protein [Thermodesulfobacteria bacterium]|nr:prephenate dehydrogenase/arogenate dehydrogenase family protein [Thermodesulfobacteriota bacterium]
MESDFTVGIIGGKGKMGQFFKKIFEKQGYSVLISDIGTELTNQELVEKSKVIFISVPISAFESVIKEISGYIKDEHWIIDICSLKNEPVKIMKRYLEKGEVLATHPLFGPFEKNLKNKTIAFWPIKGENVLNWFVKTMSKEGVRLVKVPPKKHDKIMAIVQVLNHFWLILLGNILKDSGIPLEEIIVLSTPAFLHQLEILTRFSKQSLDVYEKIQLQNPWGKNLRKIFYHNCKEFLKSLDSRNAKKIFEKYFQNCQEVAKELEVLLHKLFPNEVKKD